MCGSAEPPERSPEAVVRAGRESRPAAVPQVGGGGALQAADGARGAAGGRHLPGPGQPEPVRHHVSAGPSLAVPYK